MSGTCPAPTAPSARLRRRRMAALVPVLAAIVLLSACGSSEVKLSGPVVKDGIGCQPTEVARRKAAPTITPKTKVGAKLGITTLIKGTGCPTDATSFLSIDLIGAIASTGKVFTNTFESGHPLTTQLGKSQLIAGLETGFASMKVGERRQLLVPSAQAYGKDGNPSQHIGKDEDLVFVADLISVTQAPVYCAQSTGIKTTDDKGKTIKGKPISVDMPVKVPTDHVEVTDLKVGTGKKVGKNTYVTVNYLGISCLDGQQFDSSWDRGQTFTAALGTAPQAGEASPVIPGWSTGLETARVGGLRQIAIPYPLAYGAQGQGSIGADASLVFVIQIIAVSDKAPAAPTTTTIPASTTTAAPGSSTTTTTAAKTTTTTGVAKTTTTTTKK